MDMIMLQSNIFAHIFKLSNMLQVYLDGTLKEDKLTSKQMFLMIVIDSFGDSYPTFKEAADRSGSSYQNIKQLALKLEKNGYVEIKEDSKDRRAKRLILTTHAKVYWENRGLKDNESMEQLFGAFSLEELTQFFDYINRIEDGIAALG